MVGQITKKDLEEVLDKTLGKKLDQKLGDYQSAILDAVDAGFVGVAYRFDNIEKRLDALERSHQQLLSTLDAFLKRLTDREDEMTIMKAELNLIKRIIKQKLGVEVSLQGK